MMGARRGSTPVAVRAGGPARSSGEVPVMGARRRGRVVRGFLLSVNHTASGGGGTGNGSIRITGQAVRYFEAGRLGGLAQGQGESGRAGSGWPKHRRLPQGPEEQSVQGLESDVVGLVLSAPGARGGDRKAARRGEAHAGHPDRGRPHRPNGGGQAPGGTGR